MSYKSNYRNYGSRNYGSGSGSSSISRIMDKVANGESLTDREREILSNYDNSGYNRHDGYVGRRYKDL